MNRLFPAIIAIACLASAAYGLGSGKTSFLYIAGAFVIAVAFGRRGG